MGSLRWWKCLCLDCINVNILFGMLYYSLEYVTMVRNWVNVAWNLTVSFLTNTCKLFNFFFQNKSLQLVFSWEFSFYSQNFGVST